MPFDDRRNPSSPSLSTIWKGILTEEPNFKRSAWGEVSEEGKDFVRELLIKDHAKRPAAAQMLEHPWLQSSFYSRNARPLSATVVQRLQVRMRYTGRVLRCEWDWRLSALPRMYTHHIYSSIKY